FLGEHVDARARHPAVLERPVQGVLVEDATARGVDDAYRRLDLGQCLVVDQTQRVLVLGQVDRDEVGALEKVVERGHLHPYLRGPGGLHERVVGDDLGAERGHALGDQGTDPAEPDHTDGLFVQLDTGVLGPLPLTVDQGAVCRGGVACGGQQQVDGRFGGADDVGGGGVDHQDPGLGGRVHVHVVQTDTRAGDHLEFGCRGHCLGVDPGRAAYDQRIDVVQGREQLGPVGAVDVAHLEVLFEEGDSGG